MAYTYKEAAIAQTQKEVKQAIENCDFDKAILEYMKSISMMRHNILAHLSLSMTVRYKDAENLRRFHFKRALYYKLHSISWPVGLGLLLLFRPLGNKLKSLETKNASK